MTHEPECNFEKQDYRGNDDRICYCAVVHASYRRGYNDHARGQAKAEAMYGTYSYPLVESVISNAVERGFNQNGEGTNP